MFQLTWLEDSRSRAVMEKLKAKYGGSIIRELPKGKNSYKSKNYVLKWWLGNGKLVVFINDVLPFLILKRRQARIILRFQKFNRLGGWQPNGKPQKVIDFQSRLYALNKTLNHKNGSVHAND